MKKAAWIWTLALAPGVLAQEDAPAKDGPDPFVLLLLLLIFIGIVVFFVRYRQNPLKTREEVADFIARLKGEKREGRREEPVSFKPTTTIPEQFTVERELIEEIKHLQFMRKSPAEIRESLRSSGWDEKVIEDAFRHLKLR